LLKFGLVMECNREHLSKPQVTTQLLSWGWFFDFIFQNRGRRFNPVKKINLFRNLWIWRIESTSPSRDRRVALYSVLKVGWDW